MTISHLNEDHYTETLHYVHLVKRRQFTTVNLVQLLLDPYGPPTPPTESLEFSLSFLSFLRLHKLLEFLFGARYLIALLVAKCGKLNKVC